MSTGLQVLFWILVFPGFLFTLGLGLVVSWLVRKVSALVQWRVGPPFAQPLVDILKLMGKEVLVPEAAHRGVFVAAPLVGLSGVLLLATMLWWSLTSETGPVGDVFVALYLMVLPSLALILGSSASASPHAAIGTSREMKLVLGYELPLALALVVVLIKAIPIGDPAPSLSLATLAGHTPVLSLSGLLAFLVALLSLQAKLGFVPFDMAESETELAGGILMEYSGVLLALWKVMQAMMLVALPLFLVVVFMGGIDLSGWSMVWGVAKLVLVWVLMILIKNTNPRVRIDQAIRFFWIYCGTALGIAVVLAMIGRHYRVPWL